MIGVCRGQWGVLENALGVGKLEWNEGKLRPEFDRRIIRSETIVSKICEHAPRVLGKDKYDLPFAKVERAVLEVAREYSYHPVRDYLNGLRGKRGEVSLAHQLAERLVDRNIEADFELAEVLIRKTLHAAVARIFTPGIKVDTALIFVAEQGTKKSSAFRALATPEWFSDTGVDLTSKDAILYLHRIWIWEWAELATKRRGGVSPEEVKAFVSRQRDLVRLPYGRDVDDLARWGIIVGSTNRDDFLDDPTGSRRWWPIATKQLSDDDLEWIQANRDLIWAEAVGEYDRAIETNAQYRWWLSPEEEQRLDAVHARYRKVDSLTERALEAAESFGDEGFGTDEGMEKVFFLDGRNVYVGRNDIYARVKDIWRSNGWVFRKWTVAGKRETAARWRRDAVKETPAPNKRPKF